MKLRPAYKMTDCGPIPEDWCYRPVSDLGEVITGKALAVDGPGELRPYLRTKNVFDGRIDIDDVLSMPMTDEQFRQFMLKEGDVLLNEGQSLELVGRCAIYGGEYPGPCAIQNQLLRFRAHAGVSRLFTSYLFRYCQQKGVFARVALQTTSIAHLGGTRFEQLLLPWPPSQAEQRAIAAALSDVDALLDGLDRLIAKKRDIKQAAVQQLLTGQTRLPGFHGEWDVKRLGEIGSFLKGSRVRRDEASSGDLPCIRYGEIYTHHNDYIRSFNSHISPTVAATATRLSQGDLLFAGSGETKEEIGKCAAFVDDHEAYAGGDIVILRLADAHPMFMGYYCNTAHISAQKASKGQGDAVVHIGAAALSSVEVVIPSLPEQTAIAEVLTDIDTELAALEARRDKTRDLKQAMTQELLTGKTRLVQGDAAHA